MIGLIDYGAGNLHSVNNALRHLGAEVMIVRTPDELDSVHAIVLPGVGAFDDCVRALKSQNLFEHIRRRIHNRTPFLGICLGYQILFEGSEEFGSTEPGLGVFGGRVVWFPELPGLKVPQIGWNALRITRPDCPLYKGIADGSYVYFVHSYYPVPTEDIVATQTEYGVTFASSVWRDNVFGVQFHPEKSQKVGLKILENFLSLSAKLSTSA